MSSHREAPEIAKDPVADSTDVYAFVSPDRPDTVTIIANYIPLEDPAGGPNFFEFGDDVLYRINIDNDGDGRAGRHVRVRVHDADRQDRRVPLQHRADRLDRQPQLEPTARPTRVTEIRRGSRARVARRSCLPAVQRRARSTPNYAALADSAVYGVGDGIKVFAGQRLDGFFVDLGSVFDLGALRPFQNLHLVPTPAAPGRQRARARSTSTRSRIQVPIDQLAQRRQRPSDPLAADAVIGVWTIGAPPEGPAAATDGP